jgi:hypothetical protein
MLAAHSSSRSCSVPCAPSSQCSFSGRTVRAFPAQTGGRPGSRRLVVQAVGGHDLGNSASNPEGLHAMLQGPNMATFTHSCQMCFWHALQRAHHLLVHAAVPCCCCCCSASCHTCGRSYGGRLGLRQTLPHACSASASCTWCAAAV